MDELIGLPLLSFRFEGDFEDALQLSPIPAPTDQQFVSPTLPAIPSPAPAASQEVILFGHTDDPALDDIDANPVVYRFADELDQEPFQPRPRR